ncbi:MAG: DUF4242 domain-containing protein, partial [Miltoncostaeaceae bacterium]
MELFTIRRRHLCRAEDIEAVDARSNAAAAERASRMRKVRSYILDEGDGWLGSICVYEADGAGTIEEHAAAAGLACHEVERVSLTDVARDDPSS